ncbi:TBC1 domain family member 1 [Galemys pyrenaicus]|uniref:TBC1 domain family member 1 n=1 Tax=Galemys pyrenaicus TaxID=202257 RepID=A0A8J6ABX4_GALPY|nr:TBC1 domain family member 1 [Galemys pyrenaicus]
MSTKEERSSKLLSVFDENSAKEALSSVLSEAGRVFPSFHAAALTLLSPATPCLSFRLCAETGRIAGEQLGICNIDTLAVNGEVTRLFCPPAMGVDDGHLRCCAHAWVGMHKWEHLSLDMASMGGVRRTPAAVKVTVPPTRAARPRSSSSSSSKAAERIKFQKPTSEIAFPDYSELGELPPRSPLEPVCEDGPFGPVPEEKKRTSRELRELWQKAILQQILLLRMEKENQKLQASENDLLNKRLKLDYEEITPCLKEVTAVWEKMLSTPGRSKIKFDMEKMHSAVGQGVPRHHRGEIWKFLAEQYHLKHPFPSKQQPKDTPYKELLKQLTSQQHAILIDLGRTFPTHPYFSAQLGAGQLSLYNILKAYSLLDQEVGYCQGLSFVAGILLLHMGEEEAFHMLKFLMFDMGLRKQYRPDMIILQIQMYQLSRLLHDYHRDLYNHLEEHEIGPSLYAAPWFLTVFASQFPLGFVARVFDMIFLQGSEVIFKVALSLLGSHKPLILQHENLETIVDFIKSTLPNLGLVQMEKTISQVFEMDIAKQLQAYEVEYHVLQEELIDSSPLSDNQRMDKLEKTNSSLRKQNLDLLEQLQVANGRIQSLEATVEKLLTSESKLKQAALALELERLALLQTVEQLRRQAAEPGGPESDRVQPGPTGD